VKLSIGDAAAVVDAARKEMAQSEEPWAEDIAVAEAQRNTSADSAVIANLARRTYDVGRVQTGRQLRQENSTGECGRIWEGMDAPSASPP
jgi:hypothetical protein